MKNFCLYVVLFLVIFVVVLGCSTKDPASTDPSPVATVCTNVLGYSMDDDTTQYTNGALIAVSMTAAADSTVDFLYAKHSVATGNFGMGIYSDNSDEPGTLLVEAPSTACVLGWVSVPITPSYSLTAGTKYWLVAVSQSAGLRGRPLANTNALAFIYTYTGTMPINPGSGWTTVSSVDLKMYALDCN